MVVEDEPDVRLMFSLLFEKQGFEVETACDGDNFLKKVDSFQPDAVALDIMMPGPNTHQIIEELKKKEISTKIILVTGLRFSSDEEKEHLNLEFVEDLFYKPVGINKLCSRFNEILSDS